jgi:hypothetical protein
LRAGIFSPATVQKREASGLAAGPVDCHIYRQDPFSPENPGSFVVL